MYNINSILLSNDTNNTEDNLTINKLNKNMNIVSTQKENKLTHIISNKDMKMKFNLPRLYKPNNKLIIINSKLKIIVTINSDTKIKQKTKNKITVEIENKLLFITQLHKNEIKCRNIPTNNKSINENNVITLNNKTTKNILYNQTNKSQTEMNLTYSKVIQQLIQNDKNIIYNISTIESELNKSEVIKTL